MGISKLSISSPGAWKTKYEYLKEGLCEGVQCKPEVDPIFSYNKELPNGEDSIYVYSEDSAASFSPEAHTVLRVDNVPPYGIKLKGMPKVGRNSARRSIR